MVISNQTQLSQSQTLTKDELIQHLLSKMEGNMQLLYTEGVRICSTMTTRVNFFSLSSQHYQRKVDHHFLYRQPSRLLIGNQKVWTFQSNTYKMFYKYPGIVHRAVLFVLLETHEDLEWLYVLFVLLRDYQTLYIIKLYKKPCAIRSFENICKKAV